MVSEGSGGDNDGGEAEGEGRTGSALGVERVPSVQVASPGSGGFEALCGSGSCNLLFIKLLFV